jgi:hypothetical protein
MFNPTRSISRSITRLVVIGIVGVTGLAVTPAAFAKKPLSKVRTHLRRAHHALDSVASAAATGNVAAPLATLTSQLGMAANISMNLAVHAQTPNAEAVAANALSIVAHAEANAENVLTADVETVKASEEAAVLKADLQVTESREMTLSALSNLSVESQADANAISDHVANLSASAKGLLVDLVASTTSNTIGCPSPSAFEGVVASDIPASVQAQLDPVSVSLPTLNATVNGNGTLLSGLVSGQASDTSAQVSMSSDCTPVDSGDQSSASGSGDASTGLLGNVTGNVSGSGSGSVSGDSTGSANVSGALSAVGSLGL